MVSYFKAELIPHFNCYSKSHMFKVKAIVNDKVFHYNVEVNNHSLVADGFIDIFLDGVKHNLKNQIKKEFNIPSPFRIEELK